MGNLTGFLGQGDTSPGQAKRQGHLDPAKLAGMLGQENQAIAKHSPRQMGLLNALMDADGDVDVDVDLSDIMRRGGGMLGKMFGA